MFQFQLTDVVKNLIIINALFFFGTLPLGEPAAFMEMVNNPNGDYFMDWGRYILALFYPKSEYFQPFQVVTHMFMHADFIHILFNMFMLFIFGPQLEQALGAKRFLSLYFLAGAGAFLLHLYFKYAEITYGFTPYNVINVPMLGASGAVYGVMAGYGFMFPHNRLMLIFPPIPVKAIYLVTAYMAISLFMGIGQIGPGIAHYAHAGGGIIGAILVFYWRGGR